jgi:Mg2+/citrate symporter
LVWSFIAVVVITRSSVTDKPGTNPITYPVLLASVLSPFALIVNVAFPYWDFVFTLIYNLSLGRWVAEGITATFITAAMLVFAVIFSELLHRRVFCSK